jgi:hypothetical protein
VERCLASSAAKAMEDKCEAVVSKGMLRHKRPLIKPRSVIRIVPKRRRIS